MTEETDVPEAVLQAFGFHDAHVQHLPSLINRTFLVEQPGGRAIVQRLHPVFAPEVHLDIEAVTAHLAARGLQTPRLLRTVTGALWLEHEAHVWRALDYVEGVTHQRITAPAQAHAAGAAVARFHQAVDDLHHDFHFTRAGVHDTAEHLRGLGAALASPEAAAVPEARALGDEILAAARGLPLAALAALPRRLCHGDLKISNLRFAEGEPPRVLCLIDLDTLGYQSIAYELGDALRSWCNPHPEDTPSPQLDAALFEAALGGYAEAAPDLLERAETRSLVTGTHAVCIELSSRFCRDAIEDRYFGWDPERYASRRAHNLARARSQLALAGSVEAQRDALESAVRRCFG